MAADGIFSGSRQLQDAVKGLLGQSDADLVVQSFQQLCQGQSISDSGTQGGLIPVLLQILDRVAYFPVRPADMKVDLERVGLNPELSRRLSEVWAEHARTVVARRRTVNSNLADVNYELLTNVSTGEERIRLRLNLRNPTEPGQPSLAAVHLTSPPAVHLTSSPAVHFESLPAVHLTFTPEELFQLFEHLETIQGKVDGLCS